MQPANNEKELTKQKSLVVSLCGEPNAGKSTLLNRLVGEKIAITTPKVQTTRKNARGVVTIEDTQIIFCDTPGLFKAQRRMEKGIVQEAINGITDSDIAVMLFDAKRGIQETLDFVIRKLKSTEKPKIAVINKVDAVNKRELLEIAAKIAEYQMFDHIFMISASMGDGVLDLVNHLLERARPGPWFYEEDQLTDVPVKTIAEEITREKLYLQLNRELPYSLKVDTDKWEEKPDGSEVKIYQSIYVLKASQKQIIIGKSGEKIKRIGQLARREISELLDGAKVHLFLHVKVREDWIDRDYAGA
jgi:GTP-binding protein Era